MNGEGVGLVVQYVPELLDVRYQVRQVRLDRGGFGVLLEIITGTGVHATVWPAGEVRDLAVQLLDVDNACRRGVWAVGASGGDDGAGAGGPVGGSEG